MEIIIKCISKERDHAREIVEAIIDSEQNYLFTNDLDYKENKTTTLMPEGNDGEDDPRGGGGPGGPPNRGPPNRQPQMSQGGGNTFVRELRTRIDSYFQIVLRSVKDSVPKAIGYFLVRMSQEKLQFELYNAVNSNTSLQQSLGEPTRITERRKMLQGILDTLKNSLKVLQRDPE
jgi:vacuolar protein sorting-associated protein 1